jgi:hypothetical protein
VEGPGALVAGLCAGTGQIAYGTLHAFSAREKQREVGKHRVFAWQRQGQADQPFGQIERNVQGITRFLVKIPFIAAPQGYKPAIRLDDGTAEAEQLAAVDARRSNNMAR